MKYRGYAYVVAGLFFLAFPPVRSPFFVVVHAALIALGVMLIAKQVKGNS